MDIIKSEEDVASAPRVEIDASVSDADRQLLAREGVKFKMGVTSLLDAERTIEPDANKPETPVALEADSSSPNGRTETIEHSVISYHGNEGDQPKAEIEAETVVTARPQAEDSGSSLEAVVTEDTKEDDTQVKAKDAPVELASTIKNDNDPFLTASL